MKTKIEPRSYVVFAWAIRNGRRVRTIIRETESLRDASETLNVYHEAEPRVYALDSSPYLQPVRVQH